MASRRARSKALALIVVTIAAVIGSFHVFVFACQSFSLTFVPYSAVNAGVANRLPLRSTRASQHAKVEAYGRTTHGAAAVCAVVACASAFRALCSVPSRSAVLSARHRFSGLRHGAFLTGRDNVLPIASLSFATPSKETQPEEQRAPFWDSSAGTMNQAAVSVAASIMHTAIPEKLVLPIMPDLFSDMVLGPSLLVLPQSVANAIETSRLGMVTNATPSDSSQPSQLPSSRFLRSARRVGSARRRATRRRSRSRAYIAQGRAARRHVGSKLQRNLLRRQSASLSYDPSRILGKLQLSLRACVHMRSNHGRKASDASSLKTSEVAADVVCSRVMTVKEEEPSRCSCQLSTSCFGAETV